MKLCVKDPRLPIPGAVLQRDYNGRKILVEVLEDGFSFEGRKYGSISSIAQEVTGKSWKSGYVFFGLGKKQPKNEASAISPTDASLNNLEEGKEEFSE